MQTSTTEKPDTKAAIGGSLILLSPIALGLVVLVLPGLIARPACLQPYLACWRTGQTAVLVPLALLPLFLAIILVRPLARRLFYSRSGQWVPLSLVAAALLFSLYRMDQDAKSYVGITA